MPLLCFPDNNAPGDNRKNGSGPSLQVYFVRHGQREQMWREHARNKEQVRAHTFAGLKNNRYSLSLCLLSLSLFLLVAYVWVKSGYLALV